MLFDYLVSNYEKGEPIFLTDIVIEGMTEENIRYQQIRQFVWRTINEKIDCIYF